MTFVKAFVVGLLFATANGCVSRPKPKPTPTRPPTRPTPACDEMVCIAVFDPVCGSDGKTYGNRCIFNVAKCKNPRLMVKFEGACEKAMSDEPKPCKDICPEIYDPLCGTDGKTYDSKCKLAAAICDAANKGIKLAYKHKGPCGTAIDEAKPCNDICPSIKDPQCGTDGKTYYNKCKLLAAICQAALKGISIAFKHKGPCDERPTELPKPCNDNCPKIKDPVCGSDGKTYDNKCDLAAAICNATNQGIKLAFKHRGPCDEPPTRPPPKPCNDVCPEVYEPVCGTDGKTYGNKCKMYAAICHAANKGIRLAVKHRGPCDEPPRE